MASVNQLNSSVDEIHRTLAHPLRRRILECLLDEDLSFTELSNAIGESNHGKFGFHLRKLKHFVELETSTKKYHLTAKGRLLVGLVQNFRLTTKRANKPTSYARNLTIGDHAMCLYKKEDFKHKIVFPFLEAGFSMNQAVIYIVSEHKLDSESRKIQKFGIDPHRNEAFTIMSANEWYLKRGKAQPKTIITNTRKLVKDKLKAGFTGIRGAAEMEVFFDNEKTEELLEYEKLLGRKLALNLCALCLYKTNHFTEKQFTRIANSHGHIISQNIVGKTAV